MLKWLLPLSLLLLFAASPVRRRSRPSNPSSARCSPPGDRARGAAAPRARKRSDRLVSVDVEAVVIPAAGRSRSLRAPAQALRLLRVLLVELGHPDPVLDVLGGALPLLGPGFDDALVEVDVEIGRASCRERV